MDDYNLKFSEPASTNLYIIRILSAQMITICHIVEGLGFYELGNFIGSPALGFFFLMSGLLISHNVFIRMKRDEYTFKQYFFRRFSRIYPNFLLVLGIIFFLDLIWIYIMGGQDYYKSFNIISFIFTLLFFNDSVFGISSFGSARQLWALPPFWWLYMLFGWLVLSKRDLKKKYLYYLILAPIIIIMILICLGFNSFNKIQFSFMWFLGVAFVLLLNKFNSYIQEKETKESPKSKENVLKTKKTVKYISLLISIGLFVSAFIRLYFHQNPFGIIYYLLLVGAVLFILVGSQYANFTYPKKMRRIIKFLANYSLTLYLLHFSLCNLLLGINDIFNDIFSFIVLYVIANIASIGVAYVSEMRSDKFYNFLQRKFNLN